uniref:Uncharacterized protein n=1 Tax=Arundo donax TaxID=35708 RepID=A0A0A9A142_ARUDO
MKSGGYATSQPRSTAYY